VQNGKLSFWMDRDHLEAPPTASMTADRTCDVAIVGGGLTGLWTAWALAQRDPSLSIAVFEAMDLGFGASGRNGGWLSAKPVGMRQVLQHQGGGRDAVITVERLLEQAMGDVVDILGADAIDAAHGGWLQVARSGSEQHRLESYLDKSRNWGIGDDSLTLLTAEQTRERVAVAGATGALYSPHNYRVDPAKMLFALARLVTGAGVEVYTRSPVSRIRPGALTVGTHHVTARRRIVIATEGYSSRQRDQRRRMLPLNSAMLVTEPLTAAQWAQVGWQQAEGLSGAAHTYFYGQRTADGRIAIGGRGKPYRFRSGFDHLGRVDQHTVSALRSVLTTLFPDTELQPAHAWCGVLGVPRDWTPFIDEDTSAGIIRAGGYAGQGLTASHLAGRIIADLISEPGSELTTLPWVRPAPRNWEPEPLRWIGANSLYRTYAVADWMEHRFGNQRTSRLAVLADTIAGR